MFYCWADYLINFTQRVGNRSRAREARRCVSRTHVTLINIRNIRNIRNIISITTITSSVWKSADQLFDLLHSHMNYYYYYNKVTFYLLTSTDMSPMCSQRSDLNHTKCWSGSVWGGFVDCWEPPWRAGPRGPLRVNVPQRRQTHRKSTREDSGV